MTDHASAELRSTNERPGLWQYLRYCYGRGTLPASMNPWVTEDLTGPGAARRTVIRFAVPCALILIPFLFIKTSLDVRLSMTLPIFIPFLYFSLALNKIYRRARLRHHALDPTLIEKRDRIRNAPAVDAYNARYRTNQHNADTTTTTKTATRSDREPWVLPPQ
ncbi:DUF5313 domain-containing protein [Tsukamurella tyrosinosolvens]|uniref:DUF5313 domain-containing protein n=1 Tax=Tsukamurella tyrosinosolvens TaxID=57704 RepID=UPI000CA153F2|nr:DUF5313 domain-containing protein [Tsukamurella tyrosinosolvens]AUN41899.1 hypothetical protein ASU32_19400 [Tsukamurella tyrosinosolvens]